MRQVFASYSRFDEAAVRAAVRDLESLGCTVWLDQQLSGGEEWWREILHRIRSCEVFLFALSEHSLTSKACNVEYEYALALGKPVLPVLLSEGLSPNLLPARLARMQVVEFKTQTYEWALNLGRALRNLPHCPPLPELLPPEPPAPISYLVTLRDRVDDSGDLDFENQSSLLLRLRSALRDPSTADDARVLLERFRARKDLFAEIAAEANTSVPPPQRSKLASRAALIAALCTLGAGVGILVWRTADSSAAVLGVPADETRVHRAQAAPSIPAPATTVTGATPQPPPSRAMSLEATSTSETDSERAPKQTTHAAPAPQDQAPSKGKNEMRRLSPPLERLQGVWQVAWTDFSNRYEGTLKVRGTRGTLRVRYTPADTGKTAEVVQAITVDERAGGELVVQGHDPHSTGSGTPGDRYTADHAHVAAVTNDGVADAKFCDSNEQNHKCFRAQVRRVTH